MTYKVTIFNTPGICNVLPFLHAHALACAVLNIIDGTSSMLKPYNDSNSFENKDARTSTYFLDDATFSSAGNNFDAASRPFRYCLIYSGTKCLLSFILKSIVCVVFGWIHQS